MKNCQIMCGTVEFFDYIIFSLLQDCCLVVYHPYRPLVQYVSDISNTDDGILPLAWYVQ